MALQFHPKRGQVLYCDFTTGFIEPEMVKVRPVVVLSRTNQQVCTIVPLSGTEPNPLREYHWQVSPESLPPHLAAKGTWWAKCDMITTVAFARLDRVRDGKDANGKRLYSHKCISAADLRAIHNCILFALCLNKDLTWAFP